MLIKSDPIKRNHSHEHKLWHDENLTPSLGCSVCPDKSFCGGLSVKAPIFSCLDFCCGNYQDCDIVCRKNKSFVKRFREIDGFDLATVQRANEVKKIDLPRIVPFLYHRSRRVMDFHSTAFVLPFFRVVNSHAGKIRFESRKKLDEGYKISPNAQLILSGTERDQHIEDWWGLGGVKRREIIRGLKMLGIDMVTVPNYSLFTDQPRWDDMHSMKRIAIVWQEFIEEGLAAALHVNARTDRDWERWIDFIRDRSEVNYIAYEFSTGAGWISRYDWHIEWLARLSKEVDRPVDLVVRGRSTGLNVLSAAFKKIIFIETSSFMKTVHRQRAILDDNEVVWVKNPTDKNTTLDELLDHNWRVVSESIMRNTDWL